MGNHIMTSPLQSILVTDWSERHLAGHDLNGGQIESFNLATTLSDEELFRYDMSKWSAGDIATLLVDPVEHRARLRVVTPQKYVLRVREFQIFDILSHAGDDEDGRHIFLKGTAKNGATYVMPMLGYTAWEQAWDFTDLRQALSKAQIRQREAGLTTLLSHDMTIDEIGADRLELQQHVDNFNEIFYPGSKQMGTPFDKASSLTITTLTVKQAGPATRAQMFAAAFVKKLKPCDRTENAMASQSGTSFSPPYFEIDGEKVFIRTN
jgi:hypothetical protein